MYFDLPFLYCTNIKTKLLCYWGFTWNIESFLDLTILRPWPLIYNGHNPTMWTFDLLAFTVIYRFWAWCDDLQALRMMPWFTGFEHDAMIYRLWGWCHDLMALRLWRWCHDLKALRMMPWFTGFEDDAMIYRLWWWCHDL